MTSRPVGQEGHCSLVVCSSPWPSKEFDCNGDVATRVDMRTTKVKFFKKYLSEGIVILARSFVLEDEYYPSISVDTVQSL